MSKQVILTEEGLRNLENELENLKTVKRKEVAEKIKVALSFGDLSENSEYDEAKNEQAIIEARILEIESRHHASFDAAESNLMLKESHL